MLFHFNSRLASGIISPSELLDSPTQSIPHSPKQKTFLRVESQSEPLAQTKRSTLSVNNIAEPSVFEDETNAFGVENTPAQFSCATSLSNLSLDDEPKITKDCLVKEMQLMSHPSEEQEDVEEELDDNASDNLLLQNVINVGIQSRTTRQPGVGCSNPDSAGDSTKNYCTEDTPALLSKTGSNTNLSAISIASTNNDPNMSSESLETSDTDERLLEEAIKGGIAVKSGSRTNTVQRFPTQMVAENPIDKMRRGALPPYLPVGDELSRFGVEDSPKTLSVKSGLSDLTVGSAAIGIAKLNRYVFLNYIKYCF